MIAPLATEWTEDAQKPAEDRMTELLAPRRFSAANPPPPERVIYRLGDAAIATAGNVEAVCAKPKDGKSSFLGGMIASTMTSTGDTFGVSSDNRAGGAVIHIDTEQSPSHHHNAISRALHRAGRHTEPEWLYSYRVADLGLIDRCQSLRHEIETRQKQHGTIHSVFLDGVADFISDPNNPEEAFAWVDELHQLAIKYETVIVCVLHENPGSETGKTRGHLGSQLERKAETNLRLMKDGEGITVVFSERSRGAHIPKAQGPRFAWSDDEHMHMTVESISTTKADAKAQTLSALAAEIMQGTGNVGLAWGEVHTRIEELEGLKRTGARRRFDELLKVRAIFKTAAGRYRLP